MYFAVVEISRFKWYPFNELLDALDTLPTLICKVLDKYIERVLL